LTQPTQAKPTGTPYSMKRVNPLAAVNESYL